MDSASPTGAITYQHCRQFVDDILLVSDEEIVSAVFRLYEGGLVVEPSEAAACCSRAWEGARD